MATEKLALARLPPIGSLQAQDVSPRATQQYHGLTGPSYTLGARSVKHNLPPPHVLKPHQDTKAGGLETWPAHATGNTTSTTSVNLTRDHQLVFVDEEAAGKTQLVPKPRFLDQLESFLKKELKSLGVNEVEPSELRLQAYREVFEYLIEDFKTYKPLLSAIKNEYEMTLAQQRELIRQMEPLKQMLVTVSEQCDQKIISLREQEKQDLVDLKQENRKLYKRMDESKQEQVALETQVERLQEELAAQYLRYRDECDSKKLLIADINELRYQQEDMMASRHSMQQLDGQEKDDPVTLKIALKKAREDESAATKRLNEITANYGDVIPRRDYETIQKQYESLEEKLEQMKSDFISLKNDHDSLLDVHKQVVQQRDEFYVERETLRRSSTPRPNWERCADNVAGGITRWKELSEGKTSDQLVEVLLGEIGSGASADTGGAEYFDGKGMEDSVPKFLQFEGQVRNRRLGKRDTILLVRDIWREKAAHDAERNDGKRESLSDFLLVYLQRRFGLEKMVVEWGYNLHDAVHRYAHDEKIGLFCAVLNGKAEEELHHDELQQIAKLLNHLVKKDVDQGNQGTMVREDIKGALRDFFPEKSEESLQLLIDAAETELEAKEVETLEYKNLFMEDDEGKTGAFLDEIKQQNKQTRFSYVEDIKESLPQNEPITVDDLKKAITMADPEIDQKQMDVYLCWAFSVESKEKLDSTQSLELSFVIERLQNGLLKRVGKKT